MIVVLFVFFCLTRHDFFFFLEFDFYFLINWVIAFSLGCLSLFVLIDHHFLTRVYK